MPNGRDLLPRARADVHEAVAGEEDAARAEDAPRVLAHLRRAESARWLTPRGAANFRGLVLGGGGGGRPDSRLYRSQILQVNTRWKALAEIYTMHFFAPLWNRIPLHRFGIHNRKLGEKGPGL